MKTRIIGAILIVLVLGGLYVVTESDSGSQPHTQSQSPANPEDAAMKSLSIN